MDNVKNDNYYLKKIHEDLEFIVLHMRNVDIEELHDNEILLDSMLFRMIQLSENAKNLRMTIKLNMEKFHGMQCMVYETELFMIMAV